MINTGALYQPAVLLMCTLVVHIRSSIKTSLRAWWNKLQKCNTVNTLSCSLAGVVFGYKWAFKENINNPVKGPLPTFAALSQTHQALTGGHVDQGPSFLKTLDYRFAPCTIKYSDIFNSRGWGFSQETCCSSDVVMQTVKSSLPCTFVQTRMQTLPTRLKWKTVR